MKLYYTWWFPVQSQEKTGSLAAPRCHPNHKTPSFHRPKAPLFTPQVASTCLRGPALDKDSCLNETWGVWPRSDWWEIPNRLLDDAVCTGNPDLRHVHIWNLNKMMQFRERLWSRIWFSSRAISSISTFLSLRYLSALIRGDNVNIVLLYLKASSRLTGSLRNDNTHK